LRDCLFAKVFAKSFCFGPENPERWPSASGSLPNPVLRIVEASFNRCVTAAASSFNGSRPNRSASTMLLLRYFRGPIAKPSWASPCHDVLHARVLRDARDFVGVELCRLNCGANFSYSATGILAPVLIHSPSPALGFPCQTPAERIDPTLNEHAEAGVAPPFEALRVSCSKATAARRRKQRN